MKYIDSGKRHTSQAFGTWLHDVLSDDVTEIRWQSGFFSADALGVLDVALERLAKKASPVRALIGSNEQGTTRAHVELLLDAIRVPRDEARLGVIAFQNSFFHPKTFHVRRADGSQASYVGSANLTAAGVSALHVEAAITTDTRDGDPDSLLNTIAQAVDSWFSETRSGFYLVNNLNDIGELTASGILSEKQIVKTPQKIESTHIAGKSLSQLKQLFEIPPRKKNISETHVIAPTVAKIRGIILPSVPRSGFPDYLLFAQGATVPTRGELALSGASLPSGVDGLVIKLNHDNSRHFDGRPGTANASIPVATLGTFRFGVFNGRYARPRVEFPLEIRFVTNDKVIGPIKSETSIMAYGFIAGESGHGDVRMVIPAICRDLIPHIKSAKANLPTPGDVALLQWPTPENGALFSLTFIDKRCALHLKASGMLTEAVASGGSLGGGACWLPRGLAPVWYR